MPYVSTFRAFGKRPRAGPRLGTDTVLQRAFPSAEEVWRLDKVVEAGSVERLRELVEGSVVGAARKLREGVSAAAAAEAGSAERASRAQLRAVLDPVLVQCCRRGKGALVGYLLSAGASPNACDASGRRCLHLAAAAGDLVSVRSLLEHGADKTLLCGGVSAQTQALSSGRARVAQVLGAWVSAWDLLKERPSIGALVRAGELEAAARSRAELLRSALAQKEQLFGPQHAGLAATLDRLARELAQGGDLEGALSAQRRAVALVVGVGVVVGGGGGVAIAEKAAGEATGEASLGEAREQQVEMLGRLGSLCLVAGCFPEAEQAFAEAERALVSLRGLGAAAELLPEGVFDGRRVELRPHLARCRRLLEGLAQALEAQHKYVEEQDVLVRVIALLRRETGDPDHPSTVRPLLVLGRVQAVVGDRAAALLSLALALAVADKHLGPLHLDIATCLDNLAEAMFEAQRFAEAEALFRRALAIREQLLDPRDHASALRTSENNVSMAIVARGKRAKRRALAPVPAAASHRSSPNSSGSLGVA